MKKAHRLHKYGNLMLWAGVLVWVPYFALRIIGESPSLVLFLPFHLLGVISGGRMRMSANKQLGKPVEKRQGYKRVAHYLVITSLLVWIPYYVLKLAGRTVELTPFLIVHLTGIFSGTGLMGLGGILQVIQKKRKE